MSQPLWGLLKRPGASPWLAGYFGSIDDPEELARRLSATPGIVEHGLFPPHLVSEVVVGQGWEARRHKVGG